MHYSIFQIILGFSGLLKVSAIGSCPSNTAAAATPTVAYRGINIAGGSAECNDDAQCPGTMQLPLTPLPLTTTVSGVITTTHTPYAGGPGDGQGQMNHFNTRGFNVYRLPVSWQYLINDWTYPSSTLNGPNMDQYEILVQQCLDISNTTQCIVDLHSYARFNGAQIANTNSSDLTIPTVAQFTQLWGNIANRPIMKNHDRVMFELMNEPHGLTSLTISDWTAALQGAVNAIRAVESATKHVILIPSQNWQSVKGFIDRDYASLSTITNPPLAGSNPVTYPGFTSAYNKIWFALHYYIVDAADGHVRTCPIDGVNDWLKPVVSQLRCDSRVMIITETGTHDCSPCESYIQNAILAFNTYADVVKGFVGWGAGYFQPGGKLVLTPKPTTIVVSGVSVTTVADRSQISMMMATPTTYSVFATNTCPL